MNKNYPPTPELDKMKSVNEKSQAIGEFLDLFLPEKGIRLMRLEQPQGDETIEECRYVPVNQSVEKLLAEYFEIDLNKCEKERRAILEHIRAQKP
jgi:hypothetical protein